MLLYYLLDILGCIVYNIWYTIYKEEVAMNSVRLKARAKINISLDVLGKRENGYHELEMIMQTINLYDKINMKKMDKDKIIIKTNVPFLPIDDRNLVYKIIQYMKEVYAIKQGVYVDLFKVIPISAGLAGGSTDGATTIQGMNDLFDLDLSLEEMLTIGKKFGTDIPYCLVGGTAIATGLGDEITYLDDFPDCFIVVVKPVFSMSTQYVYKNLDLNNITKHPDNELIIKAIQAGNLSDIANNLCNVLETVTTKQHPEINEFKKNMRKLGALGALMSGSGSCVYGLFKDEDLADEACIELRKHKSIKFAYKTTIYNRKR